MSTTENYIGLVGFGSQGKAWALNLRDSNRKIKVFLREKSSSQSHAEALHFEIAKMEKNEFSKCHILLLLIPDHEHKSFLENNYEKLPVGIKIIYAHGFSVAYQKLAVTYPQFTHLLLAPKAIASEVRFQYETKGKLLGVYGFSDGTNQFEKELLALGRDLGLTSIFPSTFKEETKADLYSEQALLCSLIPYGAKYCFEKLVANGIDPKLALLECFLELRSISKAFVDIGPEDFFKMISPNALLGSEKAYHLIFDNHLKQKLDLLWNDIDQGDFQNTPPINIEKKRNEILKRFNESPLTETFKKLKSELS